MILLTADQEVHQDRELDMDLKDKDNKTLTHSALMDMEDLNKED